MKRRMTQFKSLKNTDLEDAGFGHAVGGEDFQFHDPPGLRSFKAVDAFPQIVE
jgi:hypothetical protein